MPQATTSVEARRTSSASCVREFLTRALLAAGTQGPSASAVAQALTEASLRGVDSHGIRLINHYVRVVSEGRVNPNPLMSFEATGAGTGIVDADNGFGHCASYFAVDEAIRLTVQTGIAAVSVIHSSHFGAAGCYVLRAARRGFLALATCNSDSFVLPHEGTRPFHGTNPLAFAAPVAGHQPLLLDMATSVIPWNRVEDLRAKRTPLPPDVSVDLRGAPTLDPEQSAALLPLGGTSYGYKGAGLAAMAEVLSAILTGMPHCSQLMAMTGPDFSTARHLGHLFILIDPNRFVGPERYEVGMKHYLADLRSQPAKPSTQVLAPGDREWAIEAQRLKNGIPVVEPLHRQFEQLANQLQIPKLQYI